MSWKYAVLGSAWLALGCGSTGTSNDGSSPQVAITAPLAGAEVNGTVSIDVLAVDDFGVDQVRIFVDNTLLTTLFTAPYHANWNTSSLADNSTHVIKVEALDLAKNIGTTQINVTVKRGPQ
jgi:poly(3-hydroxybutyrate) depolymerase